MTKRCKCDEELLNEFSEEIYDFLSSYDNINLNNTIVQQKIEELVEALVSSISDLNEEAEDEFLSFQGNMDTFGDNDE